MNEQVNVFAKDGSVETIKPSSELFVCAQSESTSLREVAAVDLEVGEWVWMAGGGVCNQEVAERAGLADVQCYGQPAEPEITDK
jgi:hypothetical protein